MNTQKTEEQQRAHRFRFLAAAVAALLLLAGPIWFAGRYAVKAAPVFSPVDRGCLVIDPGHGGVDGGAIAYNGVKESELNLAIALKLRDLAAFYGVDTRMTREDESPRTDLFAYSEHEDLVYRAQLTEETENAVLISIHQNTFPTSQPSGAQVLYGSGEESRRLGELTQRNVVQTLQPNNRRVATPASRKLYVPSHVSCPNILVECGFLSNLSDLQLLCDKRYQSAFAAVLLSSYLQFTSAPNT